MFVTTAALEEGAGAGGLRPLPTGRYYGPWLHVLCSAGPTAPDLARWLKMLAPQHKRSVMHSQATAQHRKVDNEYSVVSMLVRFGFFNFKIHFKVYQLKFFELKLMTGYELKFFQISKFGA